MDFSDAKTDIACLEKYPTKVSYYITLHYLLRLQFSSQFVHSEKYEAMLCSKKFVLLKANHGSYFCED